MDALLPMQRLLNVVAKILPLPLVATIAALRARVWHRFDAISDAYRRAFAVAVSILLHLCLLLLLLPPKTGLTSFGATGLGSVNGPGMAVTLVEAGETTPPQASEEQSSASEESASSPPVTADDAPDPAEQTEKFDEVKASEDAKAQSPAQAVTPDSQTPSESTSAATAGAHGQNGPANTDLWNAIAPCWNKLATRSTLSATLTISFTETGELSVAPTIERDPDAPITRQTLISEGKALAALKDCGAYPMASGQTNVTVVFPVPAQ